MATVRQCLHGEIGHRAAVIAAAHGGYRHAELRCALDGLAHGEVTADLTHRVAAVDHQRRALLAHHLGLGGRIHPVPRQLLHILGHPQHAVRMAATQIRHHQRVGKQFGVILRHGTACENRLHQRLQLRRRHHPVVLPPWILRHC
jgi:hypothetical protein